MSRDVIRWGILGCGDVCEVKSGPGFQKAAGSRLVAVMRRDPGRAEDYARRHSVPRWYDDAQALIDDEEVDAVYIATPPGSHLELARRVAAAGKPCLVEKPMARHRAECEAMLDAFGKVPFFVAYYRRCLPRFGRMAERVRQLGCLHRVEYHLAKRPVEVAGERPWRLRAVDSGGGLFMDVGCHALDLLDHLFGPLKAVSGEAENRGHLYPEEDHVVMRWEHDRGLAGSATFDFAAGADRDELTIIGERGLLRCSLFEEAPVRWEMDGQSGSEQVPHPPHVHQPLIQSVVDELLGRGGCPATSTAGLRTAKVMDGVLEAYYGGRARDFWNEPSAWPGGSRDLPIHAPVL